MRVRLTSGGEYQTPSHPSLGQAGLGISRPALLVVEPCEAAADVTARGGEMPIEPELPEGTVAFSYPTHVRFGVGAIAELPDID